MTKFAYQTLNLSPWRLHSCAELLWNRHLLLFDERPFSDSLKYSEHSFRECRKPAKRKRKLTASRAWSSVRTLNHRCIAFIQPQRRGGKIELGLCRQSLRAALLEEPAHH